MCMEKANKDLYQSACDAIGRGDVVNALALLTQVIAAQNDYADARLLRGQILMKIGDAKGAQQDAEWLMEHHPQLLAGITGDFTAKGKEHVTKKNVSNLNPFGV